MIKKIKTYILLTLLLLCQSIMAQNKTPTNDSPSQTDLGIFALPPLELVLQRQQRSGYTIRLQKYENLLRKDKKWQEISML
jgi:hypothetical protein